MFKLYNFLQESFQGLVFDINQFYWREFELAALRAVRVVFKTFSTDQLVTEWALASKLRRLHAHGTLQGVEEHLIMAEC